MIRLSLASLVLAGSVACSDGDDGNGKAAAPQPSGRFADTRHCELARQLALGSGAEAEAPIRDFYLAFDEVGEEFVATAPDEIEPAVQIFADGVRSMRTALEAIDYDPERFEPDLVPQLKDPKYAAAAERVVAFFTSECGAGGPSSNTTRPPADREPKPSTQASTTTTSAGS